MDDKDAVQIKAANKNGEVARATAPTSKELADKRSVLPEHIVSEKPVIHPALDWRDRTLLMGVKLNDGGRAVLTSDGELIHLDQLKWPICDEAGKFTRSPVSQQVAERIRSGYGRPANTDSAYALVDTVARLAGYYRKFVIFPTPWWPEVLALWTLGTYLYPVFSAYPYLRISSPQPGCGKSLLGGLISKLSFNGEMMASPTEANIFRIAESERGTQVWDEVENEHETEKNRLGVMKAVLLQGYSAGGFVPRQERSVAGQFGMVRFHVYVPRALIGLSDLPTTVQQRMIELPLHRRSSSEQVDKYLANEREDEERELREMCALFALSYCQAIAHQYRRADLSAHLEKQLDQAGRLVDDLILPLVAIAAAPMDGDERSRKVIRPLLQILLTEAAPILSQGWKDKAEPTPQWLACALEMLEGLADPTPTQLADAVSNCLHNYISPEKLSRSLAKYGIYSTKSGDERRFRIPPGVVKKIREKYSIAAPSQTFTAAPVALAPPPESPGQNGQSGQ